MDNRVPLVFIKRVGCNSSKETLEKTENPQKLDESKQGVMHCHMHQMHCIGHQNALACGDGGKLMHDLNAHLSVHGYILQPIL